jgi:membrane associated rhomboid family serine protease
VFLFVALLIVLGFALYVMTPEERARLVGTGLAIIRQVRDRANHGAKNEPFRDALRARTRWVVVTPAFAALNLTTFVFMLAGGALGDPQTLVEWGGSFGPRTTNGEWWRIVTSMFVHARTLHLLANVAGLMQPGFILERLVGHAAFAAVYVAAGAAAGLVSLAAHPLDVSAGASGAVCGIYGLLFASLIWGILRRSPATIPLTAVKELAPAAAVFILYNATSGGIEQPAALAALGTGFVCGLVLAKDIRDRKPPARRVAAALAATLVIAVAFAVPLRGVADVRPEIARIVAIEDRTARAYQAAVDQFKTGSMSAAALARVIDRTVVPELQAGRARLQALDGVPQEYQTMVAGAEEYLQLREESWRLRAEALQKGDMVTLRKAGRAERRSLEALEKIQLDSGSLRRGSPEHGL